MNKKRKFKNDIYLDFIHKLPCAVNGKSSRGMHAHHTENEGFGGMVNDYTAIPLLFDAHFQGINHISKERLSKLIGEDYRDRVIFYLSMFIEMLFQKYDLEADESNNFIELKRKMEGIT